METIHAVFIINDTLYAAPDRPHPTDPAHFLPITDMLIGIAILFGTVGCVVIFRILYRKWKSQTYRRNSSDILPTQKKNLTEYEKRMLADKINESRQGNIKKSFAGTVSSKGMIFVTIGLIVLVLLWVAYLVSEKFHR
ncbi:MAG: hypothetical protein OXI43_03990 [Candidatus Poribacteria bacterium]|nr:hypothetical protein [Candidatus Poribacteria bacterium]